MRLTVGMTLASTTDTTKVLVIRESGSDVSLTCGGAEMADPATAVLTPSQDDAGSPTLLGKRYVDSAGTVELLCTKGGPNALALNGQVLSVKTAKALPASD